jgi:hypothetical protein
MKLLLIDPINLSNTHTKQTQVHTVGYQRRPISYWKTGIQSARQGASPRFIGSTLLNEASLFLHSQPQGRPWMKL